jgi:uncharacterized protein (DUF924 family)
MEPQDILAYWFGPPGPDGAPTACFDLWFQGGPAVDREIANRFGPHLDAARDGAFDGWLGTPHGRLALVILLDQFPRNAFRDTAQMYAYDERALDLALEGLELGTEAALAPLEVMFLLLPLEHAENIALQRKCVRHFERLLARTGGAGEPLEGLVRSALDYAVRHRVVVERFGRFPHRNAVLNRESTPEERAFLAGPGAPF